LLVFTRKREEAIIIGDGIEVRILRVGQDSVKIGVTAPPSVAVHRQEIYDLIRRSAADGAAVILVANDFEELARLCGRVVVLRQGRVVGEVVAPAIDSHRLTELAYRTED